MLSDWNLFNFVMYWKSLLGNLAQVNKSLKWYLDKNRPCCGMVKITVYQKDL